LRALLRLAEAPKPSSHQGADVLTLKIDNAIRGIYKSDQQSARCGLATSALSHQTENLSLPQRKADPVNSLHCQLFFGKEGLEEALLQREVLLQILYAHEVVFAQLDQLLIEVTGDKVIAAARFLQGRVNLLADIHNVWTSRVEPARGWGMQQIRRLSGNEGESDPLAVYGRK